VQEGAVTDQDAKDLMNYLASRVQANPNTGQQAVVTEALRELWQGARTRNDQHSVAIYNRLLRVATGTQGG
jgi:hypothetical protein